jgi:hypothetical protein
MVFDFGWRSDLRRPVLFRRFRGRRTNRRPAFFRSSDDSPPTLRAQSPFRLLRRGLGSLRHYARFLLGRGPSLPLRFGDPCPRGPAHLAPFCARLRRGRGRDASTGQQLPEFCNLSVEALLLRLETFNRSGVK